MYNHILNYICLCLSVFHMIMNTHEYQNMICIYNSYTIIYIYIYIIIHKYNINNIILYYIILYYIILYYIVLYYIILNHIKLYYIILYYIILYYIISLDLDRVPTSWCRMFTMNDFGPSLGCIGWMPVTGGSPGRRSVPPKDHLRWTGTVRCYPRFFAEKPTETKTVATKFFKFQDQSS